MANKLKYLDADVALKMDAADSVFFNRELEKISKELFEVPVAALKGLQMVPAYTDIERTDEQFTFRMWDYSGDAARIKDYTEDAPPVNLFGTESSVKLVSFGDSFIFSRDEVEASARYNRALDTARAMTARTVLNQKLDKIASLGDGSDLKGLLNLSGTDTYNVPDSAAGGGTPKRWIAGNKTSDEILKDMNSMFSQVVQNTNEVENPTRLALPTKQYEYIKTKRVSTVSDTTVLEYFKDTNPGKEVVSWTRLAGAGAGGTTDRMIAYDPNPNKVRLLLPILFEQMPAKEKGMGYIVNCRMKTGGVIAIYPKSIIYGDDI